MANPRPDRVECDSHRSWLGCSIFESKDQEKSQSWALHRHKEHNMPQGPDCVQTVGTMVTMQLKHNVVNIFTVLISRARRTSCIWRDAEKIPSLVCFTLFWVQHWQEFVLSPKGQQAGQRQRHASAVPAAISTLVLLHLLPMSLCTSCHQARYTAENTQCSSSQTTDV